MELTHRVKRMSGRDPHEAHRAATPLELLFDLTFVVAFSQAASQAAHYFELGHVWTALVGFSIAVFAVTWAWINFSWLSSAYDTDDVPFRIATFVQMIGVIVVALSLPPFFHSLEEGEHVDNSVMVAGYVLMRLVTVALWLRAAAHDPDHRTTCLTYAAGVGIVQVGWVVVIFVNPPVWVALLMMVVLVVCELLVPWVAEGRARTPWYAHHIAERYSLLVIITLGEVIVGTVTAVSAAVEEHGWSAQAVAVAAAGTLLAFGMWWVYFIVPSARILHRHRDRAFAFGYLHIPLFGAIAAVGAGLHVAALRISGEAHVDDTFALLTVALPTVVFVVMLAVLYDALVRRVDGLHLLMFVGAVVVVGVAVVVSLAGAGLGVTLLITSLAPLVVVVGYEAGGHRKAAADLVRLDA